MSLSTRHPFSGVFIPLMIYVNANSWPQSTSLYTILNGLYMNNKMQELWVGPGISVVRNVREDKEWQIRGGIRHVYC